MRSEFQEKERKSQEVRRTIRHGGNGLPLPPLATDKRSKLSLGETSLLSGIEDRLADPPLVSKRDGVLFSYVFHWFYFESVYFS